MTQKMIEEKREKSKRIEKENINPYTYKYLMQNDMQGCPQWRKQYMDTIYFGRYI